MSDDKEKPKLSDICEELPFKLPEKSIDIGQYAIMPGERERTSGKYKYNITDACFIRQCKRAGFNDTTIAKRLNIDEKLMRKHYRKELDTAALDIEQALSESILFRALHADDPKVAQKSAEFYLQMRRGWKKDTVEDSAAVVLQVAERLQQAKEARDLALEKVSDKSSDKDV